VKIVILLGSESDRSHAQKIIDGLDRFVIPHETFVVSAHKVPELLIELIQRFNAYTEPLVYITVAGRSNGLSGVTAGSALHPVIACPPFSDRSDYLTNIHSSLQMPKDTPVLTVVDPANAALSAARILALFQEDLKLKIRSHIDGVKRTYAPVSDGTSQTKSSGNG
tara:strand:+ start:14856 stop:15353 length:498 start_codon:yes stop_codon:yes gene_type:complete